ncbi:uncharacterized protein PFL1_06519 [Pseudozyma flocculosa PF-1]|uniref:YMC020W-like alpha/beta hydrolase domain-containing protein n=2 Tax=Pseudozyma flocculosa TaxID=84751 RepID=A0A5C3F843_9BASI|nr:uncharacterized protein PFL1_06519 [Pseudozyma flocculosa PF-1]EPQ25844.1 hypothetical protein PFL1_06519 [Pseudozyma flocculosa PF-1]SPO40658.1 uncharacterized protein PSFLO_06140 [Pseudozyma flocculosa]
MSSIPNTTSTPSNTDNAANIHHRRSRPAATPSSATARFSFLVPASGQAPSFTLPKSASSAAITTSSHTTDALSRSSSASTTHDPRSRQPGSSARVTANPSASRRSHNVSNASESLRRVASSSTLDILDARGTSQGSPPRPQLAGAPRTRQRLDSRASVASGISQHSAATAASLASLSSFRNPGDRLLAQRPASVYAAGPTSDNITASGRAADNRSHLTALGHASQVRDQSLPLTRTSRRLVPKSASVPTPRPSSKPRSIASDAAPLHSERGGAGRDIDIRFGSFDSQRSHHTASSANSASSASDSSTHGSQLRSRSAQQPRRRPQSFLHKPPSEPSNATARHIGPKPPAAVLTASPDDQSPEDIMTKRRHDQLEAEQGAATQQADTIALSAAADKNATVRQRKPGTAAAPTSPPSSTPSRRKTWFGLGGGRETKSDAPPSTGDAKSTARLHDDGSGVGGCDDDNDDEQRRRTIRPHDVSMLGGGGGGGDDSEPPPPMDEAEAAFRASLGLPMGTPSSSSARGREGPQRQDGRDTTAEEGLSSRRAERRGLEDSHATIRPARSRDADRAMRAARRVTWFGWRGADPEVDDAGLAEAEEHGNSAVSGPERAEERRADDGDPSTKQPGRDTLERPSKEDPPIDAVAEGTVARHSTAAAAEAESSRFRTITKRGWLGRQYEVQEAIAGHEVPSPVPREGAAEEDHGNHDTIKANQAPLPIDSPGPHDGSMIQDDRAEPDALQSRPSMLSLRGLWNRAGKLPDAVEVVPASAPPPEAVTEMPSAAATSGSADAASSEPRPDAPDHASPAAGSAGAWRWSLWRGGATDQAQPAGSGSVAIDGPADGTTSHVEPAGNVGADRSAPGQPPVQPMDIDPAPSDPSADPGRSGPPSCSGTATTSWTYSSYLASWVPTWVYNAQKEAEAEASQKGAAQAHEGPVVSDPAPSETPRTPAEQVKADALARDDPPVSSPPVVDPGRVVLNEATRQGWISFFSSRSSNRPKEVESRPTDGDGLEVMDISDMETAGAGPSASPRPDLGKTAGATRPAPQSGAVVRIGGKLRAAAQEEAGPGARGSGTSTPAPGGSIRAPSLLRPASKPASVVDGEGGRPSTPLGASKDNVKSLGKAALAKASNASAALALGVGSAKKKDAPATATGSGGQDPPVAASTAAAQQVQIRSAPAPNLVLPSFEDTFTRAPRAWAPKVGVLERTLSAVNSYLFGRMPDLERMKRPTRFSTYAEPGADGNATIASGRRASRQQPHHHHLAGKAKTTGIGSSKDKGQEEALREIATLAQPLPRAWPSLGQLERAQNRGTAGVGKVVVIGVHGWFTQSIFKTIIGEPTGTSLKFATMQADSVRRHFAEAGLELNPEAITVISLQGDGKVADRVDRLFSELLSRPQWVKDLADADAVLLAAHSQGAVVATQLLARLIEQRQVRPERSRICLLAMCGIHHGPFAHLRSSITSSYINYFETAAAKELFDFQSSQAAASAQYTASLRIVLDAGVKAVYVGSADDNVVPLYSALNSSNSHPSILRALYIDGQAFPKVDFLTNLLVLCVAVKNAGLDDHNLLTLLSASVAGSLYGGTGHSRVYEERAVYDLATRYLFEVSHPLSEPTLVPGYPPGGSNGSGSHAGSSAPSRGGAAAAAAAGHDMGDAGTSSTRRPMLVSDHFEAQRWNPYELPWSLRGLMEDKHVRALFADDILGLLDDYEAWTPDPKNKTLKDLQWRLAPMKSIARPKVERATDSQQQQPTSSSPSSPSPSSSSPVLKQSGGRVDQTTPSQAGPAGGKPGSSKL